MPLGVLSAKLHSAALAAIAMTLSCASESWLFKLFKLLGTLWSVMPHFSGHAP
jgi:hypothetical protein